MEKLTGGISSLHRSFDCSRTTIRRELTCGATFAVECDLRMVSNLSSWLDEKRRLLMMLGILDSKPEMLALADDDKAKVLAIESQSMCALAVASKRTLASCSDAAKARPTMIKQLHRAPVDLCVADFSSSGASLASIAQDALDYACLPIESKAPLRGRCWHGFPTCYT